jgi:hypothetical protein
MGSGEHLQDLDGLGVVWEGAVDLAVGSHDLRQDQSVAWIGLRSGDAVPVAIAADRFRVDRDHHVPGRSQRCDEQTSIGLDADVDRRELMGAAVLGE